MTLAEINNRLQEILNGMGISLTALTDQANFIRDLGLDSLDVTDLLIRVETTFGIRIPDEDWFSLQTVGQLKNYLLAEVKFD
ncbi:acyl carrier protein [Spirosoma sp. SC4-14]|uniref:acyl carrier protein n=1 Tax=Spirosoma sp. SC4-14 TaxID=3128900 RepID=UPI0030D36806